MGTNFFVSDLIGQQSELIHLGKNSSDCFHLHSIPELDLNNLSDWKDYLCDKAITNEYGQTVSVAEMQEIIDSAPCYELIQGEFF